MTQNCARLRNSETLGFTQPICDTLPQANYRCHYAPHPSYQSNPSGRILEPAIAQPRFWGSFTRPNSELAELGARSRPSHFGVNYYRPLATRLGILHPDPNRCLTGGLLFRF